MDGFTSIFALKIIRRIFRKARRLISNAVFVIGMIIIAWLMLSFVDVNAHNNPLQADYGNFAPWNAFVLLFGDNITW